MPSATFNFPEDFLWGSATAAHQYEGGNTNNNWWAWEDSDIRIIDHQRSGKAADWWGGRWREDFDRAAETGQTALRLSIEWSRVQPDSHRWDESAIDHYRQMVRGLRERGITPMVTLHHFTDPLWIYQQRGWERDLTREFSAYTKKVAEALKEYVTFWCTINEPNVYNFLGYLSGEFPPGQNSLTAAYRVMTNMLRGHAAAYEVIHQIQPEAKVGMAHHFRSIKPRRSWFPPDKWAAAWQSKAFNEFFAVGAATGVLKYPFGRKRMKAARGTQDYFGLNYYTQDYAAFSPFAIGDMFAKRSFAKDDQLSQTGFIANAPKGFYEAIRWAHQFGLPIYVTENGIEDSEDRLRPQYLVEHVHQMWRAVNYGFPVKGYFHWSLVDNFEWERGWTQRFGLWALDEHTQARTMRPSAELYAEICHANALSSAMVERFAPAAFPAMFPG